MADEPAMLMPYQGAWVTVTVRDMLRERDARIAALERENAAMREIVAAVAGGWSNGLGTRIGETPADGLALKARARALLATQTPATGAMTGEEGEA